MTKPAIGKWEFRKIDNKDDVWGWMIAKELLETTEDITWSMKKINDTYRRSNLTFNELHLCHFSGSRSKLHYRNGS